MSADEVAVGTALRPGEHALDTSVRPTPPPFETTVEPGVMTAREGVDEAVILLARVPEQVVHALGKHGSDAAPLPTSQMQVPVEMTHVALYVTLDAAVVVVTLVPGVVNHRNAGADARPGIDAVVGVRAAPARKQHSGKQCEKRT